MGEQVVPNLLLKSEVGVLERYSEQFSLNGTDETWFEDITTNCQPVRKGTRLALQGRADSNAHLLKNGWAYTATDHNDGTRTVFDIHLPGDIVISPGILTVPRRSTLIALTDCQISALNVSEIADCSRSSSGAANFLLHLLGYQQEILAERVIQTTRMPAITRISWFYLSLLNRLRETAPSVGNQFVSPVTQSLLAEILGMSEVHVSRTMLRLRSLKVLVVSNRVVEYLDIDKLQQLSTMHDDYSLRAA